MNKAIIFDWSGTLMNNFSCFCKVCDLIFEELNIEKISEEEVKQTFTLPYMKFWNTHIPNLSKDEQDKLYKKYVHQAWESEIYPNAKETLLFIEKLWWKMFVVSSDPISKLIPQIKESWMMDLMTKIVGDVYEKWEVISSIVENYGLDKNKTYYIGDTSGDIDAGKKADVKTIWISWGFQDKNLLSKSNPDFLIDDIIELNNILDNG